MLAKESVTVTATAEALGAIHAALDRFWGEVGGVVGRAPDHDWRNRLATAVAEIATNIVRHAYPARPGSIRLRQHSHSDAIHACFADAGIEFVDPRPDDRVGSDPTGPAEGGFGLALARACLDRLEYRRTPDGTNCWHLEKRF